MNNNENIIKLAEEIASSIKELGAAAQLYGSWNKDFTEEERAQLSAQLREKGIETIKLYDYAELYVMADMDSAEKEKILEVYKKSTPGAFEEAAAEYYQRMRKFKAMETLMDIVTDIVMETMRDQDDESDENEDDDEEYDSDEE